MQLLTREKVIITFDPQEKARKRWFRRSLIGVAAVAVAYFLIFPLVALVLGAFRSSPLAPDATWTLFGFETILKDPSILPAFGTSLIFALSTTVGAMVVGIFFATVSARFAVPLRSMVTPIMVILAVVPSLFYVMSWGMLGSPDSGLVSKFFTGIGAGSVVGLFNVFSWQGIILVGILKVSGLAYLLLIGPVRNADRSLEDAAVMSGTPRPFAFLTITLPSLMPAISASSALLFVAGLETFEIPAMLGRPAGIIPLSVRIYDYLDAGLQPNYAAATALSLVFVVVLAVILYIQGRLLRGRDYTTIGGKARASSLENVGRARPFVSAAIVIFGFVAILLPLIQILVGSFQGYFGVYENWTTANYEAIFKSKQIQNAMGATLGIAIFGGALATVVAFLLAFFMHRKAGTPVALFLRIGSWVPATAPGIVLSLALLWTYLYTPGIRELYGTPWLLLMALVVAAMPVAVRALEGNVVQVRAELEEASRTSGAPPWRSIVDVTARLCLPGLLSAWLLVGLMMSGKLDVPLLLQSTGSQTIATLTFTMYDRAEIAEAAAIYCAYMGILLAIILIGALAYGAWRRRVSAKRAIPTEGQRTR